jgi:hypothetical protein
MYGGSFGSAWLKLQLREAALAVRLLLSSAPSLLSRSLLSYVCDLHPHQSTSFKVDFRLRFGASQSVAND